MTGGFGSITNEFVLSRPRVAAVSSWTWARGPSLALVLLQLCSSPWGEKSMRPRAHPYPEPVPPSRTFSGYSGFQNFLHDCPQTWKWWAYLPSIPLPEWAEWPGSGCCWGCPHRFEAQNGARAGKRKGEVLDASALPTLPDFQEFKNQHLILVFQFIDKVFLSR